MVVSLQTCRHRLYSSALGSGSYGVGARCEIDYGYYRGLNIKQAQKLQEKRLNNES